MQPQPSAQFKPGLPQIGKDPISQALEWLRNKAGQVQVQVEPVINDIVNNSMLGKTMQGKFNEIPQAFHETNKKLGYEKMTPDESLDSQLGRFIERNQFIGEMSLVPPSPKGLPNIPQKSSGLVDAKGNPIKSAEPTTVGTGSHLVKNAQGQYIENPNPKQAVYAQESPAYPKTGKTQPVDYTEPQPKTAPAKPVPPAERTFSHKSATKSDLLTNQKRNIVIDGDDIRTPNDANQVNATLNGYGVKGTPTEQLQATDDLIGQLNSRAKAVVAAQGGEIEKNQLINQTMQKLSYGSGYNTSSSQLQADAKNYVNDLYIRATGQDVTKGIVAPDRIPGTVVQEMKTLANLDAKSTWQQADPTKWNIRQRVSRYGRDAIDTLLDTEYPTASKLNNDMSDLYRAQSSLRKGANAEGVAMQKSANAPQPNMIEKGLNALKGNPVGYGALALGGVYGLPKVIEAGVKMGSAVAGHLPDIQDKIADAFGYAPKQNAENPENDEQGQNSHDGSIPSKFSSSTPLDDGSILSESKYAQDQQALQAKMGGEKLSDPQAYNEDMARYQQNETEFNSQQGVRTVANNTKTVVNTANLAYPAVEKADPSLINALSKGWDELAKADNGKYSKLSTYLQQLSQLSGVDLSTARSKDALLAAIEGVVTAQNIKLDTAKSQYFGTTNTVQQNTISNYTPPAPQAPAAPENANSIVGGSLPNVNLPSLTLPNIPQ